MRWTLLTGLGLLVLGTGLRTYSGEESLTGAEPEQVVAQVPGQPEPGNRPEPQPPRPGDDRENQPGSPPRRDFRGGPGFPGGFPGQREPLALLEQFDTNQDGWLNQEERAAARKHLQETRAQNPRRGFPGPDGMPQPFGPPSGFPFPGGRPPGEQPGAPPQEGQRPEGFRPPREGERPEGVRPPQEGERPEGFRPPQEGQRPEGFRPPQEGERPEGFRPPRGGFPGAQRPPATPGKQISPDEVQPTSEPLYSDKVLRTIFVEFDNQDWEAELEDFHDTDVEVPATLTVDGKKYPGVGVRFRGMSSYGMIPRGYKRSFNLSLDLVDGKQQLYGYKTLNLLNANGDASFLSSVLYSHIARQYIAAPKANLVRVVVNGENWGVYVNAQQFNKELIAENYPSTKGTRWKVPGSPGGRGGLEYLGEDAEQYKRIYEMKSDDPGAWKNLINLCKVLNTTPPDKLEAALKPILDIDETLKFLALDVVLINSDGYWVRSSDYSLFMDKDNRFHVIPHDMNEAFRAAHGPGMQRGSGSALELDPLTGLDDPRKPLRSKLLAVPALRERYLKYVREIAEKSLDWKELGPVVAQYRELVQQDVQEDTRKLSTFEQFLVSTAAAPEAKPEPEPQEPGPGFGPPRHQLSLRDFADQRRAYLLKVTAGQGVE